MKNENQTTDKATARPVLPWRIDECNEVGIFNQSYFISEPDPEFPNEEEARKIICRLPTGQGKFSMQYANAALIVQAVNQFEALQSVADEVKRMNLFIVQCDMCEGSGKHKRDSTSACSTCGGTGRTCNTPNSSDAEDLLKALAHLNAIREKNEVTT